MSSLRQRLQKESPDLFQALQRSWEIAQKEWLPAVAPSEGSYNSLPHFTNIENHLDALLGPASDSAATTLRLTTLETYLLLSGVLFHDFGRVYGDNDHAEASSRMLPQHFAALGIPSFELALSLSRIALFHDPLTARDKIDKESMEAKLARVTESLRHVRFEPFGTARELYVACLLALADHMDGSVRRAAPRYVEPDDHIGFKGAFRRLVSGTGYDPATYTIKTCLNGFTPPTKESNPYEYIETYKVFCCREIPNETSLQGDIQKHRPISSEESRPEIKADERCPLYDDLIKICCPDLSQIHPSKLFWKCLEAKNRERNSRLIISRAERERCVWPPDYLLAVALNDLLHNKSFLGKIQDTLNEMGLPVQGWYIEFASEVYDESGQRVNEPVLRPAFLSRVADEMWHLGCKLLVDERFSYEVLADSLRIENVSLVRLAVQRISRAVNWGKTKPTLIAAGTSGWRWLKNKGGPWDEKSVLDAIKACLPAKK